MPGTLLPVNGEVTSSDSLALKALRVSAAFVVALTFLIAGAQKLLHPDVGISMLARYAANPRAVAAVGCGELAIGLWLISFRFPRAAASVAIAALLGFSVLIGLELRRTQPLPCGCMPLLPGATEPHAVRRGLWVAEGRNAFLILLAAGSALLSDGGDEEFGRSS